MLLDEIWCCANTHRGLSQSLSWKILSKSQCKGTTQGMDETHINHGKSMTIFDRTYHTLAIHEYPEIQKKCRSTNILDDIPATSIDLWATCQKVPSQETPCDIGKLDASRIETGSQLVSGYVFLCFFWLFPKNNRTYGGFLQWRYPHIVHN